MTQRVNQAPRSTRLPPSGTLDRDPDLYGIRGCAPTEDRAHGFGDVRIRSRDVPLENCVIGQRAVPESPLGALPLSFLIEEWPHRRGRTRAVVHLEPIVRVAPVMVGPMI